MLSSRVALNGRDDASQQGRAARARCAALIPPGVVLQAAACLRATPAQRATCCRQRHRSALPPGCHRPAHRAQDRRARYAPSAGPIQARRRAGRPWLRCTVQLLPWRGAMAAMMATMASKPISSFLRMAFFGYILCCKISMCVRRIKPHFAIMQDTTTGEQQWSINCITGP